MMKELSRGKSMLYVQTRHARKLKGQLKTASHRCQHHLPTTEYGVDIEVPWFSIDELVLHFGPSPFPSGWPYAWGFCG